MLITDMKLLHYLKNTINNIRFFLESIKNYKTVKAERDALLISEKVIRVDPGQKIDWLGELTKPLFIYGNDIVISNNNIFMDAKDIDDARSPLLSLITSTRSILEKNTFKREVSKKYE